MSNWAYFRKHWIRPEVYPLIGAMAAALGVCSAAIINKVRDPGVGWNKAKRKGGDLLDDVEEIVPLWSSSKHNSARIFGSDKTIMDSKFQNVTGPLSFTVKIGAAEEEEEEEQEETPVETVLEAVAEVVEEAGEDVVAVTQHVAEHVAAEIAPVVDVMDEAAEVINAAIDAAVDTAVAPADATPAESAASSVIKPVEGNPHPQVAES